YRWLNDTDARPLVVPQLFSVSRRDTDNTGTVNQQYLRDPINRHELWRTVAPGAGWTNPFLIAGSCIVADEVTGCGDDHNVTYHQRRTRKTPKRNLSFCFRRNITRPEDIAGCGVESVQYSS